jgi:hypothetical protein
MQISKCLLAACAVAALFASAVRAETEAQTRARQALEQKLNELQPQASAVAPQAPAVAQPAPKPAAPPPAARPVPPTTVAQTAPAGQFPSVPQTRMADPDAIAKAREAMRQKMQELQPAPEAPAPAAPAIAPAQPAAPAVAAPAAAIVTPPVVVAKPSGPAEPLYVDPATLPAANAEALAKAQKALREKMQQPEPQFAPFVVATPNPPPRLSEPPPMAVTTPPAKKPKMSAGFPPIEGPPLPISADQNQRLTDLLQRYKTDQITPAEYQAERAKILAGP